VSREAVRPVDVPPESGRTEGVDSEIVPVKPYRAVAVIVAVLVEPVVMDAVGELGVRLKSGPMTVISTIVSFDAGEVVPIPLTSIV
jgi:hypothetical protein